MSPDNFVRWAAVTEGDAEDEASRGLQRLHGGRNNWWIKSGFQTPNSRFIRTCTLVSTGIEARVEMIV